MPIIQRQKGISDRIFVLTAQLRNVANAMTGMATAVGSCICPLKMLTNSPNHRMCIRYMP